MWFWIITAAVICCVIGAIVENEEKKEAQAEQAKIAQAEQAKIAQAEQAKITQDKKVSAKLPDAFIRLFSEEFPDFQNQITYSRAEAAIATWNNSVAADDYTRHLKFFNNNEFKNDVAHREAATYVVTNVAREISPELLEYAKNNPEQSYATLRRVIISSFTLANQ